MKFVEYKEKQKCRNLSVSPCRLEELTAILSGGEHLQWKFTTLEIFQTTQTVRQGVQHTQCSGQIYDT